MSQLAGARDDVVVNLRTGELHNLTSADAGELAAARAEFTAAVTRLDEELARRATTNDQEEYPS
jgi:hypothetical protein